MASAADVLEKVAFDLLTEPAPIQGAPVFQHVPQDTPPPVVIVGDIELEPMSGKDDDADRVGFLTVITVTSAEERLPAIKLQEQIEERLSGADVSEAGWRVALRFVSSNVGLVEMDGAEDAGYVGTSRFAATCLKI